MMPQFLGEQIQTKQRETTIFTDLVDRFSIQGGLDLRTATPEERKELMRGFCLYRSTLSPGLVEEFLEAAVTYRDITMEEVEEYLRELPKEQCYVFAVFILQNQPHLELGDLFLFCFYRLSTADQNELVEFARTLGGDAALLVVPDTKLVKEFLSQTHSFARVQEYLGYLVRSAERFEDPRVLQALQYFVSESHSLFLCVVPYITSLKRLGITVDIPDTVYTDTFFNHFNKNIAVGRKRLLQPMVNTEQEQVSDVLLSTRHAWGKTIPDSLVQNFITVPSYARHLEVTHPTAESIIAFLQARAQEYGVGKIFEHPEAIARIISYEKELSVPASHSVKQYLMDLILQEVDTTTDFSYVLKNLEMYETVFGRTFQAELSLWYKQNPLSFGSRLDLVQAHGFDGKEIWVIKNGNYVSPDLFPLVVDSYARLEKHTSFASVEKKLLVQCPYVFSCITPEVLEQLSHAELLAGIEHTAELSCSTPVMGMIVKRLGFATILKHLESRSVPVSCIFVKNLLPFVSDEEFGAYVELYSHTRPDLLRSLSPERILRLRLTHCVEYYQVLLRHRDFVSLRTLYENAVRQGSSTREHRDFIWSLISRNLVSDRELFVTMVSRNVSGGAFQYHDEHYRDLLRIAEAKLISFVREKPELLFDASIGALVDDLPFTVKEEFIALQQHFSVIADVKNLRMVAESVDDASSLESFLVQCEQEGDPIFSRIAKKITTRKSLVRVDNLMSSEIALLSSARYMVGTPLYQQFVGMGGEIPDSHLTKTWLSQFQHLVHHDDFDESPRAPFTFQQFDAEISRRMREIVYRELGLRGGVSENLEDQQAMIMYAEYAHTHAKEHPLLSHAIVKYAPFIFSEHFEAWKSYGVLQELVGVTSATLHKGFENLKRKHLLPPNLSFEQYEHWVKPATFSEEDHRGDLIHDLRTAITQTIRNGVYDEQIPAYLCEGGDSIEKQYRELRDEFLQLKKEEKEYRKTYPHEKKMPLSVHRSWEEVKHRLKNFRHHKQGLMHQYTVAFYISKLSKLTTDEVKRDVLKIPGAEVALSDVLSKLKEFLGDNGFSVVGQLETIVDITRQQLFARGLNSRKVLSATDRVDVAMLVSMGRKPCTTCQDVGDKLSTGLLSIIVDPHVRLLQVYANGELVGRAVMRLMHTAQGDPAIFVERVYKSLPSALIDDLLYSIATKKGAAMGISVYGDDEMVYLGNQKGRMQPKKTVLLLNNASRSPMNYSDAGSKYTDFGQFRIRHVQNNSRIHS